MAAELRGERKRDREGYKEGGVLVEQFKTWIGKDDSVVK